MKCDLGANFAHNIFCPDGFAQVALIQSKPVKEMADAALIAQDSPMDLYITLRQEVFGEKTPNEALDTRHKHTHVSTFPTG